ncbi:hypothetical protein FQA39_LY07599 [Lamprigera yunnana]|nr:hypothetical protein FQA39_LY07599 [Lamprigera yunnana]
MRLHHSFTFDNKNHDWPQIYVIIAASLTAFTTAAMFSWSAPSIPILTSNSSHIEPMTLEQASYFPVISPIVTIIASPVIAFLMDKLGRKYTITIISIPQIAFWLLVAIAKTITVLYISRVLSGLSDAIVFCVVPAYIGEISSPRVRGSWGNLIIISLFLSQFVINVVGVYLDIPTTAYIFILVPIIQIILWVFVPESPYFLITKNRHEDAKRSLKFLRWNEDIEKEYNVLVKDVSRQMSEPGGIKDLFVIATNRKSLLISTMMRTCQQFTGITAFAVYTPYIFLLVGGNISASSSSIIYTGILFAMASVCSFVVDKFGRRLLLIFSSIGVTIALFVEAIYFYLMLETNINMSNFNWVPLAGMMLFIITCTSGLGILPTLMLSELFSASIKSKAVCVVNMCFGVCIIVTSKLFQALSSSCGIHVPFAVFGVCTFFSSILSYLYVPETKGKSLEEIQQMLTKEKFVKQDSETQKT